MTDLEVGDRLRDTAYGRTLTVAEIDGRVATMQEDDEPLHHAPWTYIEEIGTGEKYLPLTEGAAWRERVAELQDHGIPDRRAEVATLIDAGYTHREAQHALGLNNRATVGQHVADYREQMEDAYWLVNNAPQI